MTGIRKDKSDTCAFTLTEVVVSMVIVAILAGLALQNHYRSIELLTEQEAVNQLKVLVSALKRYKTTAGTYPSSMNTASKINSTLDLNIQNTDYLTFSCPNAYGASCRAVSSYGWSLHVESIFGDFCPHCLSDYEGGKRCPTYSGTVCGE